MICEGLLMIITLLDMRVDEPHQRVHTEQRCINDGNEAQIIMNARRKTVPPFHQLQAKLYKSQPNGDQMFLGIVP